MKEWRSSARGRKRRSSARTWSVPIWLSGSRTGRAGLGRKTSIGDISPPPGEGRGRGGDDGCAGFHRSFLELLVARAIVPRATDFLFRFVTPKLDGCARFISTPVTASSFLASFRTNCSPGKTSPYYLLVT